MASAKGIVWDNGVIVIVVVVERPDEVTNPPIRRGGGKAATLGTYGHLFPSLEEALTDASPAEIREIEG